MSRKKLHSSQISSTRVEVNIIKAYSSKKIETTSQNRTNPSLGTKTNANLIMASTNVETSTRQTLNLTAAASIQKQTSPCTNSSMNNNMSTTANDLKEKPKDENEDVNGKSDFMGSPIHITNKLEKFDKNYHALLNEIYIGNWKTASLSLSLFPDQACKWKEVKNRAGNIMLRSLPIHFAIKVNAPLNFLDALLDAYPDSASMKCEKGRLPLHLACGMPGDCADHVVRRLLRMYPDGAQTPDNLGMLPLHLAAKNRISSNRKVIQMLLMKAYPEGGEIQDKQGRTFRDMTVSKGSKLCLLNSYANYAPQTAMHAHESEGTNRIMKMYKPVLQEKLAL